MNFVILKNPASEIPNRKSDYFCRRYKRQFFITKISTKMSDHIENEGKKGRFMLWFFVYFFMFIGLLIYVYQYNFKQLFTN